MRTPLRNERGIALVVVLLVTMAMITVAAGAILMTSNTSLVNRHRARLTQLETVADAGLEEVRSRINGSQGKALYPESLYNVLETDAVVYDAGGNAVPHVTRTLYVGPTGITTGQYGVFGSVVADVRDAFGNRVVRRLEVNQESFAKYAYFTDIEPSNISFGGGDQIFGPVHSNDYVKIYSSGATFHGHVTTAKTIQGVAYGTFKQGFTEQHPIIPMPQTADLAKLQAQATLGSTAFASTLVGNAGQATLRLEFIPVDIDNDGAFTGDNEGFMRVYTSGDPNWVVGGLPADYGTNRLGNSRTCGHYHAGGVFVNADSHPAAFGHSAQTALSSATRRCLLGGADSLWLGGAFTPDDGKGQWLPWPGPIDPQVALRRPQDAAYLFPINRLFNPSFKGVIFVQGKVAISGRLRGRITIAATDNIIIADDITYVTNPAVGTCNDILGLFSGQDVVIADNPINAPVRPNPASSSYQTYDDTRDEFLHGVVLALSNFTVENYNTGASAFENCGTTSWGRGCLFLTGGIIQSTRGAVGTSGGTGNLKRYSYDACAYSDPPPYFPTTGHFARGRYFEVDPTNFAVAQYFSLLTPAP